MTKRFKIECIVTVESEQYPSDKMYDFVRSLFNLYRYKSMITEVTTSDLFIQEIKQNDNP